MRRFSLLLIGFGNVGRRFVRLLGESRSALQALGMEPVVVGITTRRHGGVFDAGGVDAIEAARQVELGHTLGAGGRSCTTPDAFRELARCPGVRVVIETTTLDINAGEPAVSHVRAGIAAGAHVITANKGPAAFAFRALTGEADAAGVSFLFEGAVMDGIPIFNLVRETMPAVNVRGFRGVINSTTNHILTALEDGESFESALARMQAEGVAEADPTLDIDGWDAAAKVAALANVWLNADLTPQMVAREGVSAATLARVEAARAGGRRLKLVGRARRNGARVDAAVELQDLERGDPLAELDGQENAIEIDTWPLGRVVITQRDGGLEKTAYALVADLCTVARRVGP